MGLALICRALQGIDVLPKRDISADVMAQLRLHPSRSPGASSSSSGLFKGAKSPVPLPPAPGVCHLQRGLRGIAPRGWREGGSDPRVSPALPAGAPWGIGIRAAASPVGERMQIPALGVRVSHPASDLNPLESCEAPAKKMKVYSLPLRFWAPNFPPVRLCPDLRKRHNLSLALFSRSFPFTKQM